MDRTGQGFALFSGKQLHSNVVKHPWTDLRHLNLVDLSRSKIRTTYLLVGLDNVWTTLGIIPNKPRELWAIHSWFNATSYSTFIHCRNSDFLIGWFVPCDTELWCKQPPWSHYSCGVKSTHYCLNTMASDDSNFGEVFFAVYSIWIIKLLMRSLRVNYQDLPALVH